MPKDCVCIYKYTGRLQICTGQKSIIHPVLDCRAVFSSNFAHNADPQSDYNVYIFIIIPFIYVTANYRTTFGPPLHHLLSYSRDPTCVESRDNDLFAYREEHINLPDILRTSCCCLPPKQQHQQQCKTFANRHVVAR